MPEFCANAKPGSGGRFVQRSAPFPQCCRISEPHDAAAIFAQALFGTQPWPAVPREEAEKEFEVETLGAAFGYVGPRLPAIGPDPAQHAPGAQPDRKIEIDDGIGACPSRTERPALITVDQPPVAGGDGCQAGADLILAAFHPAGTPVELVHVINWQVQRSAQFGGQR